MFAFRETFSRPVKPIRFLGLFDTVNSVPRFENALMSRTKFPYTARSTARVIRHAVSIGERRAKFRQDLIGEKRERVHDHEKIRYRAKKSAGTQRQEQHHQQGTRIQSAEQGEAEERGRHMTLQVPGDQFRDHSEVKGIRSLSPNLSLRSEIHGSEADSMYPLQVDEEEEGEQDIQEVWFSGCHAVRVSKYWIICLFFLTHVGYWRWLAARKRRRSCTIPYSSGLDGPRGTARRSTL
jgi:uncharacterized protein (DUF2235 family)